MLQATAVCCELSGGFRPCIARSERSDGDLGGEQSPGRIGRAATGNGGGREPDLSTEQGLEAVETARGQRPRQRGAAVGREHPPKGRKPRREEGRTRLEALLATAASAPATVQSTGNGGHESVRLETRRTPDRQQDATSLRPARGENRRGGAKPRGRNETFEVAPRRPKSDRKIRREWTRSGMSMEG
jgi:hypothetical protein